MRVVRTLVACLAAGIGLWVVSASGRARAAPAATTTRAAGVKVIPVAVSETRYKWLAAGRKKSDYAELTMTVHVVGEAATKAVRFGRVKITHAVDEEGNSLLAAAKERRHPHDYVRDFITITERQREQHKNGFQAEFIRLKPAPRAAAKIAKVSGSLKLLTGGKVAEVIIPNARSLIGIEVDHPALKAAGVKVKIVKPGTLKIVKPGTSHIAWLDPSKTVSFRIDGKVDAFLGAVMVDSAGRAVSCNSSVRTDGGAIRQQSLTAEKQLPAKAGLKLEVLSGAKVVTVPFELKDIPLP